MLFDNEFTSLFNQTIYRAPLLAVTQAGDGIYGNPEPCKARVEPFVRLLDTRPSGEETFSSHKIFTTLQAAQKDHIWLPDSDPHDDSKARIIQQIATQVDENGTVSHYEVVI